MKNIKSTIAAAAAIAAMCALAGCGSTPGDSEVREALRNEAIKYNGTPTPKNEAKLNELLAKVKVVGCKPAESMPGFNCDWTGAEGFYFRTSGRIVKSEKGWILAEG